MPPRLALGLDFGTESVRAVLVDVENGQEVAVAEDRYAHGVVDAALPGTGSPLPPGWALQDADDYLRSLHRVVTAAVQEAGADPQAVVGIGIGFTACTVVACRADGTPLSRDPDLRRDPHAWVKLWKHHGAQAQADRVSELLQRRAPEVLARYGGRISAEWLVPKALELFEHAPAVYEQADRLMEAQDWMVWQLTGTRTRSAAAAGYKALHQTDLGELGPEVLDELAPGFGSVQEKIAGDLRLPGQRAGGLTETIAEHLGLRAGTPVAAGHMDAQVTGAACGLVRPGPMVLVMGTSVCNLLIDEELREVPGMTGAVKDGIIPGYWAYEAGQAAVGDLFGWFVRNALPAEVTDAARDAGESAFTHLERRAAGLLPGEHGLVALDWWNGNRSVLGDTGLSGVLVGMTLGTRPHHVYRALLEATAFGQRMIIQAFEDAGTPVTDIVACGGLPGRSPLAMQVLADVTGRTIRVAAGQQTPAVGAALHGAVAAGARGGGYDTLPEASAAMTRLSDRRYDPDPATHEPYEELFALYTSLHDHFGRTSDVMARLRRHSLAMRSTPDAPAPERTPS